MQSEARKKAVLDAKMKAEEYAQALRAGVGQSNSYFEGANRSFSPVYRVMEMKARQCRSNKAIAPGEMEITVKGKCRFLLN